ncbi:hypothetical protein CDAR_309901 [Caerostris darwini]|uniref:Protein kish n=1 Tax=Caerostris darwini TaxID=1538125 RepID=A0AAV4VWY3_9ARAC|nr:hypothetical protein CDAR_309901 [Caerostris darwini]
MVTLGHLAIFSDSLLFRVVVAAVAFSFFVCAFVRLANSTKFSQNIETPKRENTTLLVNKRSSSEKRRIINQLHNITASFSAPSNQRSA